MTLEDLMGRIREYGKARADYESRGVHEPETVIGIEADMKDAEFELAMCIHELQRNLFAQAAIDGMATPVKALRDRIAGWRE